MNCEHVKEDLSAYLDNALRLEEREYVAAHIKTCQSCKMLLADFAHFDVLLAQQPRVIPKAGLRERIFASQEYLELIDSTHRSGSASTPDDFLYPLHSSRPRFVSLPGGRQTPETHRATLAETLPHPVIPSKKKYPPYWRQRILYGIIAAGVLLSLGIGSLMSWRHWQQQAGTSQADAVAITPPAAPPQQGPLSAGTHFLFLRNGSLWSSPGDGSSGIAQLTARTVTVANGWEVRPGIGEHTAGNLIAYIDRQQGYIHIIRSDGQNDTLIPQSLVPGNELTAATWEKAEGLTILNSLSWSPDGSTLAFVGRNGTQKQLGLYLYQTASKHIQRVPLNGTWNVSHPTWSPDSKRIAFQFIQNEAMGIAEYSLESQQLLTIVGQVNTILTSHDSVLALGWTADNTKPALTWSVGSSEHVHSIWLKQVGLAVNLQPTLLAGGDYIQASYQRLQSGYGHWLFVTAMGGKAGDIYTADLNTQLVERQTRGKEATNAQWSPNGRFITYLNALTSNAGSLHQVAIDTQQDLQIGTGVSSDPAPLWSLDRQELAYSTGKALSIVNEQDQARIHKVGPQGHVTALSWSSSNPALVILGLSDQHKGIYLIDSHSNRVQQVDGVGGVEGEIQWSEIP